MRPATILTDAYDGNGDIHNFYISFDKLRELDESTLSGIELIYAAFAYIAYPKTGYELADQALSENPTSHYARLVRGRMAANYINRRGFNARNATPNLAQAIADVESLRLLYPHDTRIPIQSLATYVYVANTQRQENDSSWRETLGMADGVVKYLEQRGPSNWEQFFLAEYTYELAQSPDDREKAWQFLRALADEGHDWATNHCLAMSFELNLSPDSNLVSQTKADAAAVFGLHGVGCWYAVNDNPDSAIDCADRLAGMGSVDTVVLALEIAQLARRPEVAKRYVKESMDKVPNGSLSTSSYWIRDNVFEFYVSAMLDDSSTASEILF